MSKSHTVIPYARSRSVMPSATKAAQVTLNKVTPSHCRVVLDNPPLNLMGPEFVLQIREVVTALENDDRVKVVVFESAVDGVFLNHSDFLANLEDLTSIPQGPTGLEAWPDVLVRLTRAPFVSIALIRGRATGNGSELALACDMSFASREKALLSQFEVGVGLVAGGGPMARLPRVMGRGRALEVLLSADDIRGAEAERLGYVNRALPDGELDEFVDALATRIASFDKWAIANTKRLVNETSRAPAFSLERAERKAYTSALVGMSTADLVPLVQPGAELYPLLAVSGGRYSAMGGGVPLTDEGQVIAGVGVSGGTTEQDIAIVEAAMS